MAENEGAAIADPIETKKPEGKTEPDTKESLGADQIKDLIKDAVNENNKTWQSRFDKVLEEKKTVKQEKETTEQRIERLEQERAEERLQFAREKALAKTGLSEDVYKLVQMIVSDNAEEIQEGFTALKSYIDDQIESGAKAKFDKTYSEKFSKNGSPKKGEPVDLSAKIKEARAAGKIALALDLQRKQDEG